MNDALKIIQKDKLRELNNILSSAPQAECPVMHHFSPGVYTREIFIPEGVCMIGYEHKRECLNIFVSGSLLMASEDGTKPQIIKAPMIFSAPPGQQKAGIALEDVIWLNVWNIEGTDIDTLEEALFERHQEGFELPSQIKKLPHHIADNNDFLAIGMDEKEEVRIHSLVPVEPLSGTNIKYKVSDSNIHGKGIIATGHYSPNELIGLTSSPNRQTVLGRYVNHSMNPNAKLVEENGSIYLVATDHISGYRGGYNGDEIVINYKGV